MVVTLVADLGWLIVLVGLSVTHAGAVHAVVRAVVHHVSTSGSPWSVQQALLLAGTSSILVLV